MAQKPDTIHGKIFEKAISKAMHGLEERLPIRFSKITDTFTAGNVIAAVEGDFKLQIKGPTQGQPYLIVIEAKATVQTDKCFERNFRDWIKGTQNASMVMNIRAGASGCYFFHKVNEGIVEVWDAKLVSHYYKTLRSVIDGHAAYTVSIHNLPQFMLQICIDPATFVDALRSTRHD